MQPVQDYNLANLRSLLLAWLSRLPTSSASIYYSILIWRLRFISFSFLGMVSCSVPSLYEACAPRQPTALEAEP